MISRSLKLMRIAVLLIVPCLAGCGASWLRTDLAKGLGLGTKLPQESPDNPVIQLIPAWQEAEGPGVEERTITRGFSARIYFITQQRGLPSEVKGGVRIYLFDDQGTEEEQSKPIYQFDFEPEAWQLHSSMTELGPAYNVFIPYTRKGRNQANCALRIRYNPPTGTAVFSQMATLTLGGAKNIDLKSAKPEDNEASTFKSTTIDVTKSPKKMQVTQVNAEEPARPTRTTSKPNSALQTAGFETPVGETGVQTRVEPADYETETEQRTRPDVDKENPFGDLAPDKPAVRTYSIQVD